MSDVIQSLYDCIVDYVKYKIKLIDKKKCEILLYNTITMIYYDFELNISDLTHALFVLVFFDYNSRDVKSIAVCMYQDGCESHPYKSVGVYYYPDIIKTIEFINSGSIVICYYDKRSEKYTIIEEVCKKVIFNSCLIIRHYDYFYVVTKSPCILHGYMFTDDNQPNSKCVENYYYSNMITYEKHDNILEIELKPWA